MSTSRYPNCAIECGLTDVFGVLGWNERVLRSLLNRSEIGSMHSASKQTERK